MQPAKQGRGHPHDQPQNVRPCVEGHGQANYVDHQSGRSDSGLHSWPGHVLEHVAIFSGDVPETVPCPAWQTYQGYPQRFWQHETLTNCITSGEAVLSKLYTISFLKLFQAISSLSSRHQLILPLFV